MLLHGAPKLDENGKPVRDDRGRIIYEPYRIKVLNTINFSKSMKYNPLAYVRSEKDILKLVNVIIANTKGDGEKSSEDFWVSATRSLTVRSQRTNNGYIFTIDEGDIVTTQYYIVRDYGFCLIQLTNFSGSETTEQAARDMVDSFVWDKEG